MIEHLEVRDFERDILKFANLKKLQLYELEVDSVLPLVTALPHLVDMEIEEWEFSQEARHAIQKYLKESNRKMRINGNQLG